MWNSERFLWPFFSSSCLFRLSLRGFVSPTFCGVAAESPASSGCEIPVSLPEGRVNKGELTTSVPALGKGTTVPSASLPLSLLLALSSQPAYPGMLRKLICPAVTLRDGAAGGWSCSLCSVVLGRFCHLAQMLGLTLTAFSKLPNMNAWSLTLSAEMTTAAQRGKCWQEAAPQYRTCALDGASDPVLGCSGYFLPGSLLDGSLQHPMPAQAFPL